jgi:hypothetical protein
MLVTVPSARRLSKARRELDEAAWCFVRLGHRLRELPALVLEVGGNGVESTSADQALLSWRLSCLLDEVQEAAALLERFARGRANGVQLNGVNWR